MLGITILPNRSRTLRTDDHPSQSSVVGCAAPRGREGEGGKGTPTRGGDPEPRKRPSRPRPKLEYVASVRGAKLRVVFCNLRMLMMSAAEQAGGIVPHAVSRGSPDVCDDSAATGSGIREYGF